MQCKPTYFLFCCNFIKNVLTAAYPSRAVLSGAAGYVCLRFAISVALLALHSPGRVSDHDFRQADTAGAGGGGGGADAHALGDGLRTLASNEGSAHCVRGFAVSGKQDIMAGFLRAPASVIRPPGSAEPDALSTNVMIKLIDHEFLFVNNAFYKISN
jgi:hypothetical protein